MYAKTAYVRVDYEKTTVNAIASNILKYSVFRDKTH